MGNSASTTMTEQRQGQWRNHLARQAKGGQSVAAFCRAESISGLQSAGIDVSRPWLTQAEAGLVLGMCERSFRRYVSRYEADGWEGLVDQRLEQVSNRREIGRASCRERVLVQV